MNNTEDNIIYMYDRSRKELNRARNNNLLSVLSTETIDRLLHYNTFIKTVDNFHSSHSSRHVINEFTFHPGVSVIMKDYEHFMENNKYKGNNVNDINSYKLGEQGNSVSSYYYYDLYSGIHKAPANTNQSTVVFPGHVTGGLLLNNKLTLGNRGNTTPNANKLQYAPFDNLLGLSALFCGENPQSITVLPKLDMVNYLDSLFQQHIWRSTTNTTLAGAGSIVGFSLQNPQAAGGEFDDDREQYVHSDLNIRYLDRYHINHIGQLQAGGAPGPAPPAQTLSTLPQPAPINTPPASIYQTYGRFDVRYFPHEFLQKNLENRRLARFSHVMSRFLYSDNGFSFTFTRQVFFINFAFNLIRHKIKSESLYSTNKVMQGKLFYQDDFDNYDRIMPYQDSLLRQLPRNPLNRGQYDNDSNLRSFLNTTNF
jgi:hypothetical protein